MTDERACWRRRCECRDGLVCRNGSSLARIMSADMALMSADKALSAPISQQVVRKAKIAALHPVERDTQRPQRCVLILRSDMRCSL